MFSCAYCHLNYSFLGRFERLSEDIDFVASKFGTSRKLKRLNSHHKHRRTAVDLFKTLDRQTVERLYKHYELDFKAFGYSAEEFLR